MKVGIVTITKNLNLGNRLQNYALQRYLEKLGVSADTILDISGCKHVMKLTKREHIKAIFNFRNECVKLQRRLKYWDFNSRYIRFSSITVNNDKVPAALNEAYDYFIVGSDQVWNPNYKCSGFEFLTFADKRKRIAYSASFGVTEVSSKFAEKIKPMLQDMEYISVREYAGAEIVEQITGTRPEVLVDPTLLLSKDEWLKIAQKPKWLKNDKYILTYFLGEKPKEVVVKINEIIKDKNIEVINLADEANQYWFSVNPSEFVYLVNNSSLFYTDSFHGTVFALLLKVPFVCCEKSGKKDKKDMGSRFDTLLSTFDMEERRGTEQNNYLSDKIFTIDFTKVDKILKTEREKANKYLCRALKLEGTKND